MTVIQFVHETCRAALLWGYREIKRDIRKDVNIIFFSRV
jgi:hypothetical protein